MQNCPFKCSNSWESLIKNSLSLFNLPFLLFCSLLFSNLALVRHIQYSDISIVTFKNWPNNIHTEHFLYFIVFPINLSQVTIFYRRVSHSFFVFHFSNEKPCHTMQKRSMLFYAIQLGKELYVRYELQIFSLSISQYIYLSIGKWSFLLTFCNREIGWDTLACLCYIHMYIVHLSLLGLLFLFQI